MKKYRIAFRRGYWFAYRPDGFLLWNIYDLPSLMVMIHNFHKSLESYNLTFDADTGELVSTVKPH